MKRKSTTNPQSLPVQLSLFDDLDQYDPRPEPIRAAEKYNFPLQRYEPTTDRPEWLYSVQDWLLGVTKSTSVRSLWRDLQGRGELYASIAQLPYTATNGKTYQMDFVNGIDLYRVTQNLRDMKSRPELKEVLDEILKFMAVAADWVDKERADPEGAAQFHASRAALKREETLAKFDKAGMSDRTDVRLFKTRHDGIRIFNQLKSTISEVCTDTPRYGQIVNAEYMNLFGNVADQLASVLNVKNVRDGLPEMQLSYLQTAEISLRTVLQNKRLSNDEIIQAARKICQKLGETLVELSEMMGVDRVTGNHYSRMDNHDV